MKQCNSGSSGQQSDSFTLAALSIGLIHSGHILSCTDLRQPWAHELARQVQRKWISKKQIGCVFARLMSGKTAVESWVDIFSYGDANVNELTQQVDKQIEGGAQAIQIIFPSYIEDVNGFALQISRLLSNPRWQLGDNVVPADNDSFSIGLRFVIPSSNYVSWVLGLGDFDSFPATRRAPFPALIFRTGPPGPAPEIAIPEKPRPGTDSKGREPVHLADHPTIPNDPAQVQRVWQQTQKLKSEVLGNDPASKYAKAKVTASFPANLRRMF